MSRSKPMTAAMLDDTQVAVMPQQASQQEYIQEDFDIDQNIQNIEQKYSTQSVTDIAPEQELQEEQTLLEQEQAVSVQPKKESVKEYNFRLMREQNERLERELQEYKQLAFQAYQQKQAPKPQQEFVPQQPSYNIDALPDDELLEGRHLKVAYKDIYNLKQDIEKQKKQLELEMAEAKLKSMYPDLENVVSDENLEVLRLQDPDIYQSIMQNPNFYSKAAAAYRIIKKYGIYEAPTILQNKSKIATNLQKPKSTATVNPQSSPSPLQHASSYMGKHGEYSEEYLESLRREMRESKKYI